MARTSESEISREGEWKWEEEERKTIHLRVHQMIASGETFDSLCMHTRKLCEPSTMPLVPSLKYEGTAQTLPAINTSLIKLCSGLPFLPQAREVKDASRNRRERAEREREREGGIVQASDGLLCSDRCACAARRTYRIWSYPSSIPHAYYFIYHARLGET